MHGEIFYVRGLKYAYLSKLTAGASTTVGANSTSNLESADIVLKNDEFIFLKSCVFWTTTENVSDVKVSLKENEIPIITTIPYIIYQLPIHSGMSVMVDFGENTNATKIPYDFVIKNEESVEVEVFHIISMEKGRRMYDE